jgi:hypothetical protein
MKRSLIILLMPCLLVCACKKKEVPVAEPEPAVTETPVKQPDQILYKAFSPAVALQSVQSFSSLGNSFCSGGIKMPIPKDSIASYLLDVNGDQVPDFRFEARHEVDTVPDYCGHCDDQRNYYIAITGLSPENTISTKQFIASAVIEQQNSWVSSWALLYNRCTMSWNYSTGYVGIKIGKSAGYIRTEAIEENGIRIVEYGLNKTENNSIVCGQK